MCVCVCVCVCVKNMRTSVKVCTDLQGSTRVCKHASVYRRARKRTHICVKVYTNASAACTHKCVHSYIRTYVKEYTYVKLLQLSA